MRKRIAEMIEASKERAARGELPVTGPFADMRGHSFGPQNPRHDERDHTGRFKPKYDGRGKSEGTHYPVVGKGQAKHPRNMDPRPWAPPPGSTNKTTDMARMVARAVFEKNPDKLYKAYAEAALKGNGYVFQQLAERAYGKLKEHVSYEVTPLSDLTEQQLNERMLELQRELGFADGLGAGLGIAATIDAPDGTPRRDATDSARAETPESTPQDGSVLPR